MALLVYMTAADQAEAEMLAATLVRQKLAAGVHLYPIRSQYWWEGQIQHATEYALVAQCTHEGYAQLEACVRSLHSYQTPCIVAVPIVQGNPAFLDWIAHNTNPLKEPS